MLRPRRRAGAQRPRWGPRLLPQWGPSLPRWGPGLLPQWGPRLPRWGPRLPRWGPRLPPWGPRLPPCGRRALRLRLLPRVQIHPWGPRLPVLHWDFHPMPLSPVQEPANLRGHGPTHWAIGKPNDMLPQVALPQQSRRVRVQAMDCLPDDIVLRHQLVALATWHWHGGRCKLVSGLGARGGKLGERERRNQECRRALDKGLRATAPDPGELVPSCGPGTLIEAHESHSNACDRDCAGRAAGRPGTSTRNAASGRRPAAPPQQWVAQRAQWRQPVQQLLGAAAARTALLGRIRGGSQSNNCWAPRLHGQRCWVGSGAATAATAAGRRGSMGSAAGSDQGRRQRQQLRAQRLHGRRCRA
jgi:hypothetical protein